MTDIAFKHYFVDPLLSGAKCLTLRKEWKNGRTPDVDDVLQLVVNPRTPERRVFASAKVEFRASLAINARGVEGFNGWRAARWAGDRAKDVKRMLTESARSNDPAAVACAVQSFAVLDGFDSWADAWAFHDEHRAAGSAPTIWRELIGIGLVSAAFADA